MAAKKKAAPFGGKQAPPFGSKKKSAAKKTTGRGGGKIYDPDGKPNSGDEYRLMFGKKVPVK